MWEKNFVVSCNPTDPWQKPQTQNFFQHFWSKKSHTVNVS